MRVANVFGASERTNVTSASASVWPDGFKSPATVSIDSSPSKKFTGRNRCEGSCPTIELLNFLYKDFLSVESGISLFLRLLARFPAPK